MRVLFASLASVGHTYPMIPLAVAARAAGHDVTWAAGEHVHAPLKALGLAPFRPADAFYEIYAEDLDLTEVAPDLVVCGWGVPGVAVAAHRAGIPSVWHGFGRMFPDGIGLEPPTAVREAAGDPHVDICPPSLQDKTFMATQRRLETRPVPFSEPGDAPALGRPLVYLTLGTAFGATEVLTETISGLARLGVSVLVAGPMAQTLTDLPANVTARSWVPQAELLSRVDVVVHHGGSGTMLGALAAGVPQLVLPQGADQFANADALVEAGVGLRLLPEEQTADAVAAHTRKLLSTKGNSYREAAGAVAEEIAAMPSPAQVAHRLPELLDH